LPVGDVDSFGTQPHAETLRLADGLIQPSLVYVGKRQMTSPPTELESQLAPDTGCCASDGGDLAFEASHLLSFADW
jgi:hypothetical protein